MKTADLKTRLYASSIIILLVGLCGALLIYLAAGEAPDSTADYEIVSSKMYIRELQRFGGKAAVLFDEFNRWFAGLWQGKSLAITVAWISIFVSLGLFLFARSLSEPDSNIGREDNRD